MTDIQQWQPAEVATQPDQAPTASLRDWAEATASAFNIAKIVCATSMTPQQYRGKPEEAAAAIMAGAEVGLSPFKAMQSIDVIHGTAAMRAITLRAIAQSQGHEIILVESTATRCRMKGRRKGSSEWIPTTWTIDQARDLGLLSRDQWKKQPKTMLIARATSELARLVAADAIMGIPYSVEEINDGVTPDAEGEAEAEAPAEAPSGTRRMSRRKPQPEAQPEPTPEPEVHEETGEVPGITQAQSRMLHASFNDAGIKDRDQRLAYCANLIGRELSTSNDLTKAEAKNVIDALVQDANETVEAELMEEPE